ncbi:MAG: hypothetical protein KAY24_14710 [Candidatus Eisenbacteria sp.]|nr:hypothetical protein [Candidatus Eisenbacteria bacterium]
MALFVWVFECARCHEHTFMCTRCIGGRKYCDSCANQINKDSVREAGRRYQKTTKGRKNHNLRQQRLRARQDVQSGSLGAIGYSSDNACAAGAEPLEAVAPATSKPKVTHESIRPSSDIDVKLTQAPRVAAYVATLPSAEGDKNETQWSGEGKRRQDVAAVLALLRDNAREGRPVMAACCCCGRIGEVVAYDGIPRIIRGHAHSLDPG